MHTEPQTYGEPPLSADALILDRATRASWDHYLKTGWADEAAMRILEKLWAVQDEADALAVLHRRAMEDAARRVLDALSDPTDRAALLRVLNTAPREEERLSRNLEALLNEWLADWGSAASGAA